MNTFIKSPGQPVDDVYNHWAPGSPNGLEGQDGCVVLSRDGTLRDDLCTKKYPFICKKALADLEWNTECDMPNQGTLNLIYNEKPTCLRMLSAPILNPKALLFRIRCMYFYRYHLGLFKVRLHRHFLGACSIVDFIITFCQVR